MQNSKIEWCHHTANLWHGCVEVHEGCDNCYARVLNNRYHKENSNWGIKAPRLEVKSVWDNLDKYQKLAKAAGEMHRVFVGSMMDIFEKPMPYILAWGKYAGQVFDDKKTDELRNKLFYDVIPASPNLMFLLLTKRPSNINKYIPESWRTNPPVNVMFGTSPVNQETADKLIPQLLEVKGKHFLSVEPMLGHVDLYLDTIRTGNLLEGKVDWVICGGESGAHKRPFNVEWAYSLRDQCKDAGTPFFMKQIDKVQPIPDDLMIREFPVL